MEKIHNYRNIIFSKQFSCALAKMFTSVTRPQNPRPRMRRQHQGPPGNDAISEEQVSKSSAEMFAPKLEGSPGCSKYTVFTQQVHSELMFQRATPRQQEQELILPHPNHTICWFSKISTLHCFLVVNNYLQVIATIVAAHMQSFTRCRTRVLSIVKRPKFLPTHQTIAVDTHFRVKGTAMDVDRYPAMNQFFQLPASTSSPPHQHHKTTPNKKTQRLQTLRGSVWGFATALSEVCAEPTKILNPDANPFSKRHPCISYFSRASSVLPKIWLSYPFLFA